MARSGRRVLRGVLEQMRRAPRPSAADRGCTRRSSRRRSTSQRVTAQRARRPDRGPPRRSPTGAPSACPAATAPASMRAISRMFWNRRARAVSTSAENQVALLAALGSREPRRLQVAGRDADRGQRRSQIVAERGEQRRLQLFALARDLGRLTLVEKLARVRSRSRRRRRERRACLARSRPPGRAPAGRPAWCRAAAAHERTDRLRCVDRPVPRAGASLRVRIRRAAPPRGEGRRRVDPPRSGTLEHGAAPRRTSRFGAARQANRHANSRSKRRDTNRASSRDRLGAVGEARSTSRLRSNSRASSSRRAATSNARSRSAADSATGDHAHRHEGMNSATSSADRRSLSVAERAH